jgi:biofilm PGA synthesis lipoprotein PgaB
MTTRILLRSWIAGLWLVLLCTTGLAVERIPFNTRFVAIGFHDVVDRPGELDDDAVTTDRLISFFDWLRGNDWTAISLDDVVRARRGEKPLPPRSALITFDDGYRSFYTRVYPLLLAYRIPVIAALTGEWVDAPAGATVRYGGREVPRENFITWDQAREMQRSGLVEFASHTYALHQVVLGNPQGNRMPAAVTRRYEAGAGYESEAAFTARVGADLARGRALLERELGRAPRVLVWPYGRYNAVGLRAAEAMGLEYNLTLDVSSANALVPQIFADARWPVVIPRYLPTRNPPLAELVSNLQADPNEPRVDRLACLDPAVVWSADAASQDEWLGRAIERVRALGLTGLVVQAVQHDSDGRIVAAWFPTRELPLAGDMMSRIAWQMQTRAGVEVFVRLPHRAALAALGGDVARMQRLYEDLGAMVPLSGWVMEDTELPAGPLQFDNPPPLYNDETRTRRGWASWVIRERRWTNVDRLRAAGGPDAAAWEAYLGIAFGRPAPRVLWLAKPSSDGTPGVAHPLAEVSLVPASLGDDQAATPVDPRLIRWFTGAAPPDARRLADAALAYQRAGGVSLGWCPDDPLADRPEAAVAAPGVSASTFPARR